ncbi:glycosyltransferase family 4 protein [Conyzicola nivalis]|uniref:Glycosyltransferase WbuB n=1 Tax=Conyzicola nivalis TaxID=1477021 RepID=A0A916WLU5_9MICO|nr:glycosyltransferase family 4 protein [Conyzicola nivalis]GGB09930.1 glycosyltransferase WbuB [Conyzicola nivalis]
MKIGMLSQWFDPEPGPAAIPAVFAREFVAQGHEVSVLTGFPNYPSGEIYAGYKQQLRSKSFVDGFAVTRVPLYANHDSSARRRLANYASFALSATTLGAGALRGTDAIWVYNSPVTVALPLLAHSRFGKTPYFLQVQDLWPDSLIDSGMFPGGAVGRVGAAVIDKIVRVMENRSVVIGVSSPGARRLILERNSRLDPARIVDSPNPTDEALFRPVSEINPSAVPEVPWANYFTLMYVGAVGDVQGLDSLVDAATILRGERHIRVVVVGDGIARQRLESLCVARGLDNVTFVGRVDKSLVPGYTATADVQLVSLADRPFLRSTTPSKIASLLASRVPIIGQISGDGADLIRKSGAGLIASPGDADALARAISTMAQAAGSELEAYAANGRKYYEEHLAAGVVAANVVEALSAAMS